MNYKTMYYKPISLTKASLLIFDKAKRAKVYPLSGDCTIGKEYPYSECDIRIESEIVGRRHGEFLYDESEGAYYYIDNNSTNGTYINGVKLGPYNERGSKAFKLSDGDIIRVDNKKLNKPHPEAVLIIFSTTLKGSEKWQELMLGGRSEVVIGRDRNCTITLNSMMTSRRHAVLKYDGSQWTIKDKKSTNGTGLNGKELRKETTIFDHDVIRIADSILVFLGDRIIYNIIEQPEISLQVNIRKKAVAFGRKVLIKDIYAEFETGDFVLILGSSGAGKTTLVKSILGEYRADGNIILNGEDLYKNFKKVKSQIGLVPQFLTLRKSDTIRHTFLDTAGIRMGKGYSRADRTLRVENVLNTLGIKEHENKLISKLSGGQQKKAAVGNQLIGFQKVLICDEPDSGLDGASRMQQMGILKDISKENKIVMVITHEPDDAVEIVDGESRCMFTKVLVLARSSKDKAGHLAYFGNPSEALGYFNVKKLQDIMLEINPITEGGRGRADIYIEKYTDMERK